MSVRDRFSALDRLQNSRLFKIIASAVVGVVAVGLIIAYTVAQNVPVDGPQPAPAPIREEPVAASEKESDASQTPKAEDSEIVAARQNVEATARIVEDILAARQDPTKFHAGVLIGSALALVIVWSGLGLTYLGILLAVGVVVVPLMFWNQTRGLGTVGLGLAALTMSFAALLRLLSLLVSGTNPILAVARNTLSEAVRMKVGLIFIVLLILGLALLPVVLDADQPLRYRVQAFLQYATGGSFWLIAVLVLTFATSSVCSEQRMKVIWQTMTKPVTHAQYLLGKWIGVAGLAAVLLTVCAAGIFLFTEYLRNQPAKEESAAWVASGGSQGVSEDRLVLETQILVSRKSVPASPPMVDEEQFQKNLEAKVQAEVEYLSQHDDDVRETRFQKEAEIRAKLSADLRRSVDMAYRSIEPGAGEVYVFEGLQEAKNSSRPIILRFKVESGSNAPDALYHLTFQFPQSMPFVESVGLGQFHSIRLLPTAIDDEGRITLGVQNGDSLQNRGNPETVSFAKDGLEVTYAVGGYRMNFVRVMFVLWVKLAFLAMVAICASTSLSFPVASLVSFTAFIAAEGATFVLSSVEVYATEDDNGKTLIIPTIIANVAKGVANAFKIYSDLSPVTKLVSGLALTWQDVALGTVVLLLMTVVLYVLAVILFKRRELATYSGQ